MRSKEFCSSSFAWMYNLRTVCRPWSRQEQVSLWPPQKKHDMLLGCCLFRLVSGKAGRSGLTSSHANQDVVQTDAMSIDAGAGNMNVTLCPQNFSACHPCACVAGEDQSQGLTDMICLLRRPMAYLEEPWRRQLQDDSGQNCIHKHPAGCGIARVVVQILIQKCKPSQYFCLFDDVFGGPDPFIFKAESAETQAPTQNPSPCLSRAVLNFHASCLK